jgi:hypothetical protein
LFKLDSAISQSYSYSDIMNFKFNTDTNLEVGIRNDKEKKVEKILI